MRQVHKHLPGGGFTSVPVESDKHLAQLVNDGWSERHPHPEILELQEKRKAEAAANGGDTEDVVETAVRRERARKVN